jgi:hypothetical protein
VAAARPALGAHDLAGERRHFNIVGVFRHVDQALMAAHVVEAVRDKPLLAQFAHVAELHRGPGGCLGLLVTGSETLKRVPDSNPIIKVLLPGAICQP